MLKYSLMAATAALGLALGSSGPLLAASQYPGGGTQGIVMMSEMDQASEAFRRAQEDRIDRDFRLFSEMQRVTYGDDYRSRPGYQADYNAWRHHQMRLTAREYRAWVDGYASRGYRGEPMGTTFVMITPEDPEYRAWVDGYASRRYGYEPSGTTFVMVSPEDPDYRAWVDGYASRGYRVEPMSTRFVTITPEDPEYRAWADGYASRGYRVEPMGTTFVMISPQDSEYRCMDEVEALRAETSPLAGVEEVEAMAEDAARMCRNGDVSQASGKVNDAYRTLYQLTAGEGSGG